MKRIGQLAFQNAVIFYGVFKWVAIYFLLFDKAYCVPVEYNQKK